MTATSCRQVSFRWGSYSGARLLFRDGEYVDAHAMARLREAGFTARSSIRI